MDESANSEKDVDPEKDSFTNSSQVSSSKSTNDKGSACIKEDCNKRKEDNDLLLEDYNTSDDDLLDECKNKINVDKYNALEYDNQSLTSCDQNNLTGNDNQTVSKSNSANRSCDEIFYQDINNDLKTETNNDSYKSVENENKDIIHIDTDESDIQNSAKPSTVIEYTPLETFCSDKDLMATSSKDCVKENKNVQVIVVTEGDKCANKENIILIKRTTKNGEVASQTNLDNLAKKRSGTPFVECGSINTNIHFNGLTDIVSSNLDISKDSGRCNRSDSKRSIGSVKKVPISSRVELMLSNDLFKKHVGKHKSLLERISQRQGRGRQPGLKKTFSNLDLSNLDLDQEFNSPFCPSFDKQTDIKDKHEKSSSFTSGDIKMKDLNHCDRSKRRLSLASDQDLLDLQNEIDKREQFLKEVKTENEIGSTYSNRKFKFCIPSFEEFKKSRKAKLISSQKFVKDVLNNDSMTKAAVSLTESKIENLLVTKNGHKICEKEELFLDTVTEDDICDTTMDTMLFNLSPSETMPFEVQNSETIENMGKDDEKCHENKDSYDSKSSEDGDTNAIQGDQEEEVSEVLHSSSESVNSPVTCSGSDNGASESVKTKSVVESNTSESVHVDSISDSSIEIYNISPSSLISQNPCDLSQEMPSIPDKPTPKKNSAKSKLPIKIQCSPKSSPRTQSVSDKLKLSDKSDIIDSHSAENTQVQSIEIENKERVILRASRKRKINSRKKDQSSDFLSYKTVPSKHSLSPNSNSPREVNMFGVGDENTRARRKIPLLDSTLSSGNEVFPEKSPGLAGTFIFQDNAEILPEYNFETDKSSVNSLSEFEQNEGDNSICISPVNSSDLLKGFDENESEKESTQNPGEVKKVFNEEDSQENLLKNFVMRSTSDVADSTPDAHRKRRERKERPYKSDPFTGGPKLPAARLFHATGKQRNPSSLKEEFLDFTDDTSLEEVNEEEDSYISESESEKRRKMRNRLSNLSNASSDSGVNGLPDVTCDLVLSPNSSETSLYNLFNNPDNLKNDYSIEDDVFNIQKNQETVNGPGCTLCKQVSSISINQSIKQWLCPKCSEKLIQRKEAIMEIKDTEISYGRDLNILKEEFYKPMRSAGLLSADQLESIFLNLEELIAVNIQFTEKLEKAVMMSEQSGYQDLLSVNIGHLFMESTSLILAFDNYCVNQGHASILLEQLEKEKEILRIFLKVSQDENSLLRRMHLKSFLMVPVQRITRYPLLLDRIHKLTPDDHIDKDTVLEAKSKIEDILGHINAKTKQGGTGKIKRKSVENRKMTVTEKHEVYKAAIDVLGWNKKEVCDIITSRLLVASLSDQNWASKRMKSLKFTQVHGVLLTLGQGEVCPKSGDKLLFPKKSEVIQAAVVLIKEKNGKYQAFRDPFMLNRCVVNVDQDTAEMFELMELNKEPFIFRGEDVRDTKLWLQNVKQQTLDLGTWRRRRNALPNIMMKHIV